MRKIILASASPRRKELLERAGVDFEVLPASGDENRISDNPGEAVKQLASDKAASVIRTMKDSADGTIVIGSDTVVVFENVILGKPHDTEDAVNTLKKLQASTHQVYTGVSVWEKKEKVWTEHTFYESTDVTFYPVSDEEIREYFEANKARFAKGASVHAKHILVDSEEKCNELLESIVSGGKAFEDVAKESSTCPSGANGGDLGEFGKGQMVKEFEDAAFAAEIGHVVGPVKTQFGYHLIKVEDKKEAEDAKLDDLKEQIKSEIMQKKQQQAYTAKVEALKTKHMA